MRSFWISLILVFSVGLATAWDWGLTHRLTYLSRDYAFLMGKNALIEGYSRPGLAVFGDSMVMDGILPERLGPAVINCALNGCTPIESYFMIRRLIRASVHPQAILLSYNAYHFVHPDFYWENTVKFGVIKGTEADEVMGYILKLRDKELLSDSSPWDLEQRLYSFLLSRGFPSYYISSLYAEPFGARKKENEEALKTIARTRGQYFFPMADGSKELNADTRLKAFTVSPVIDHYFRATLDLCEKTGIPIYFFAMPSNESSVPHLNPGVYKAYQNYLESLTKSYSQFHILCNLRIIYPWRLFSDYAHLNEKGASRFNQELARILNRSSVPGGPYGTKK
jgi:hypothetical protein